MQRLLIGFHALAASAPNKHTKRKKKNAKAAIEQ